MKYRMEFAFIEATLEDAGRIAELIQRVWEEMEVKEWFVADSPEEVKKMLTDKRGFGYLAVESTRGNLAGVFLVEFPGLSGENLGRDVKAKERSKSSYRAGENKANTELETEEEQLCRTAHMDTAAVLKEYRGNHLQYRLMQKAEEKLKGLGYRYLMCTIHPENRYSLENAERLGYRVVAQKEKYGGYLRNILQKEI